MPYARVHGTSRNVRQLAIALVAATVLLIGWLQFLWLSQLREEETARRRVALRVASSNFQDRISREITDLLRSGGPADSLLRASVRWKPGEFTGERLSPAGPRPLGRAEMLQLLERPLLAAGRSQGWPEYGLWLEPPALVRCGEQCTAVLLDREQLADRLFEDAANRLFADFGEMLRLHIVSLKADGGSPRQLYPLDVPPDRVAGFDLTLDLLVGVPVHGPREHRWELRVGHAASSLEQAVARAHLRNLLLSGLVLLLLVLGVVLVYRYSRNQAALAQQQILFVASASHELRTPLSVIGSAADNLADGAVPEAQRVRQYGKLIRNEVGKLTAMIDNVLQFSEATGRPMEFQPLAPAGLIEEALARCRATMTDRPVQLDLPDGLPEVLGDPHALHSLLVNLLNNAGKYAEGEGPVQVAGRVLHSGRRRALAISISNPVKARRESDPETWFEPFRRGRSALERGLPGTGIGLSVARNIAQQHGGGLSVQFVGQNSIRFTLYLPVED